MKTRAFLTVLPALLCLSLTAQAEMPGQPHLGTITTRDGRTYAESTLLRVDPDGILVRFQPSEPGLGLAKVKFRNLPEALRNRYGYDAQKAADYEQEQAQANAKWLARAAVQTPFQRYRNLAELNRALAGDLLSSYSITLDPQGNVTTQGFTGSVSPYPVYGVFNPFAGTASYATGPDNAGTRK